MAESASNIYEAIFCKRPAFQYPVREVSVDYMDVDAGGTTIFTFHPEISGFRQAVDASSLSLRCWALQERILSARTVHVSDRGVFWSCPSTTASEQQVEGSSAHNLTDEDSHFSTLQSCHRWNLGMNRSQPMELWYYICEQYSRRHLSNLSDKLPALSGLATLFRDQFYREGQYFAGIWSADLPEALAWNPLSSDNVCFSRISGLPSWSWASLQTRVEFPGWRKCTAPHLRVKILDATTEKAGIDEFGQVLGGMLLLKSRVRHLSVRTDRLDKRD